MGKPELKMVYVSRQSFVWNTIGCVLSAGSSFVLLMCVTRAVGAGEGGVFSLAFATAQILLTLGKYGVRSYQATDVSKRITSATYLVLRVLTCLAMMLLCGIIVLFFRYDDYKSGVVFAVCLIKMVDAVEDVYHGQLQLNHKLDIAGKLLAFRNLFTMFVFGSLIFGTKNLLITCWTTAFFSLLVCVFLNHKQSSRYEKLTLYLDKLEMRDLLLSCFPLFLGSFLSLYIYNAPKYAIDLYCSTEEQTYYAIIFMPAFVINMFSEFAFKPLLTSLAVWWNEGELQKFKKTVTKLIGYIFLITAIVLIGMYFLGARLLSIVYRVDVMPYRMELLLLMLGGGFSASVYFLYNVLTAMRRQRDILINYFIGSIIVTLIAFMSVRGKGLLAAALSYLIAESILCFLMIGSLNKNRVVQFRKGNDYVEND